MRKPWEETWRALGGGIVCGDMTPDSWACAFWHPSGPVDERAVRARLAAAAPDLVRSLLAVEWANGQCPWCGGWDVSEHPNTPSRFAGHEDGCEREAALRKAGVIK